MHHRVAQLLTVVAASLLLPAAATAHQVSVVTVTSGSILPSGAPERPDATGTGLLLGQVVEAGTRDGIAGVTVTLSAVMTPAVAADPTAPIAKTRQVLTGSDGRFFFANLPAGTFNVRTSKNGYVFGQSGQQAPGGAGQPIELADGAKVGDLTVPMWRDGVITGTVIDEAGEPVVGARVTALREAYLGGVPQLTQAGSSETDDRGIYRLASLVPGDYLVAVLSTSITVPAGAHDALVQAYATGRTRELLQQTRSSRAPSASGSGLTVGDEILQMTSAGRYGATPPLPDTAGVWMYATTFHPSGTTPDNARAVTVESGKPRDAVDVQLQLVQGRSVSGVVTAPDGEAGNLGVHLRPATALATASAIGFDTATGMTDASGAFTMLGVPPGAYTLEVLKAPEMTNPSMMTTVIQVPGGGTIMSGSSSPGAAPPPISEDPTWWARVPLTVADDDVGDG